MIVGWDDAQWAEAQWGKVELGDARLTKRAVQMGKAMVAQPGASLPAQLGQWADLVGAYRLLNKATLGLAALSQEHWRQTRAAATAEVVLMIQDTTTLDFSHQPTMKGLGPVGNERGRGLLLHTTLAVLPDGVPQVLGVAYQKSVLRTARPPGAKYSPSAESLLWSESAQAVGAPPPGTRWLHVADRLADDFRFWDACRCHSSDFLVRLRHNRQQVAVEGPGELPQKVLDHLRAQPAQATRRVRLPAHEQQPAREVTLQLSWSSVTIAAPTQAPAEVRHQAPLTIQVVRVWEEPAPETAPDQEPLEWCLATTLPVTTVAQAWQMVDYYLCRWLIEDYHQCLKTGCAIEKRELDDGADIDRLLGFCGPIAARLLALRQWARLDPQGLAQEEVAPLVLAVLATQVPTLPSPACLTRQQFFYAIAGLGGYLARKHDGPPGWRTLWQGWQRLSLLLQGARLAASLPPHFFSV